MNTIIKREYDYALRICAFLAGREEQTPISVSKLSKILMITPAFATKIVHQLKNQGILKTVQGKEGGVYLAKAPENLTIYDILIAMGLEFRYNICLDEHHHCPWEEQCKLHNFFEQQENVLLEGLKNKTLADVALTV